MRQTIGWVLAMVVCMGLVAGCDQNKDKMSATPEEKVQPPMFPEESVPKVEPAPAPVDVAAEPAPAPAPAPKESYAAPKAPRTYVIQKGDTLQKISDKFYGTTKHYKKIFEANRDVIKDMNVLKPGTKIKIPD